MFLNTTHTDLAIQAYVWCWGKTCGSLDEIPFVTMRSCKSKTLNEFYMTLTVRNLHQKTPKGATTKIQVKKYKRDIKIVILFSDDAINHTMIQYCKFNK